MLPPNPVGRARAPQGAGPAPVRGAAGVSLRSPAARHVLPALPWAGVRGCAAHPRVALRHMDSAVGRPQHQRRGAQGVVTPSGRPSLSCLSLGRARERHPGCGAEHHAFKQQWYINSNSLMRVVRSPLISQQRHLFMGTLRKRVKTRLTDREGVAESWGGGTTTGETLLPGYSFSLMRAALPWRSRR